MCFPRVQSLKFREKNSMLPMFRKPQNLNSLRMNLVLGLFKQCSRVQTSFAFLQNESLWVALTFYGINFKITELDLFLTNDSLLTA